MKHKKIILPVVLVIASSGITLGAMALDAPPFPGNSVGQDAAAHGEAAAPGRSATFDGVRVEVTGLVADATQTLVSFTVSGHPELGDSLWINDPPRLIDVDGTRLFPSHSTSAGDQRSLTLVYPPTSGKAGELTLDFGNKLSLTSVAAETEARHSGKNELPAMHTISGTWTVQFPTSGFTRPVQALALEGADSASFGKGRISVTQVNASGVDIVVSGHITGYSPDELEDIILTPSSMTLNDGTVIGLSSGRSGYGAGLGDFELHFTLPRDPSSYTGPAKFSIGLNVVGITAGGQPIHPELTEGLRSYGGSNARFDVRIP